MSPSPSASARAAFTPFDGMLYGTVLLLWSTSWITIHFQLGVVEPVVSVLWRFLIGAMVMWLWVWLRRDRLHYPLVDHLRFAALGFCLFSTNFILFYNAGLLIVSGLMSIVFSIASVVNAFLGPLVFRQKIESRLVAGGLLGTLGVALMFLPEVAGGHLGGGPLKGLLLCLCGTLLFCVGNLVATSIQRRGIGVRPANAYGMTYAVPYLTAVCLIAGLPITIDWSPLYLTALAWTGLLATTISFVAYMTLLNRIGAARAAYVTVLSPAIALLISTVLENYQWSWPSVIGLGLVMGGNILVLRRPQQG